MITAEELQTLPIFATLSGERLERLAARAADIVAAPGDYVVHEGEVPAFFVVISGSVEVTKRLRGVERVLGVRDRGNFFGDVPLMMASATLANLRVAGDEPARLLRIDDVEFHALLEESPELNREVMHTLRERLFAISRIARDMPAARVTIVGQSYDPQCHDMRDFLSRNDVPFAWRGPDEPEVRERWPEAADGPAIVIVADGPTLVGPTIRELASALDLRVEPEHERYDLVVVGAGPAGLAASVYGASEGLATLTVEREAPGGQAGTSSRIENYLGFPSGISGDELGDRAHRQAVRLGAEIVVTRDVVKIAPGTDGADHVVTLDAGRAVRARAIVLATGVTWRRLDVAGIDRFTGRGVYYGAARTEALGVRGHDVYLVGAGNSAGQAAVFFSAYAARVTLLVRGAAVEDSMSSYLVEQLRACANVRIETGVEVAAVHGGDHLEAIDVRRRAGGESERRPADGIFVFIGADAETDWLPGTIARDERGYIVTGRGARSEAWPLRRDPLILETSVPRIFAAGDVRHGSIKRVAAGVGEGSTAIALIHQALAEDSAVPA